MKKVLFSTAILLSSLALNYAKSAEWECGQFKTADQEGKMPRPTFFSKQITTSDGDSVDMQVNAVAVNEASTDFFAALKGDEKICIKYFPAELEGGIRYFVFDTKLSN